MLDEDEKPGHTSEIQVLNFDGIFQNFIFSSKYLMFWAYLTIKYEFYKKWRDILLIN